MNFLEGKKTYLGILIAVLPTLAGLVGYNVTTEGASELGASLSSVLTEFEELIVAAGAFLAVYGRKVTKG